MYDNVGRHYISFLNVSNNDIYGEDLTTYWFMYFQILWAINLKTAHKAWGYIAYIHQFIIHFPLGKYICSAAFVYSSMLSEKNHLSEAPHKKLDEI